MSPTITTVQCYSHEDLIVFHTYTLGNCLGPFHRKNSLSLTGRHTYKVQSFPSEDHTRVGPLTHYSHVDFIVLFLGRPHCLPYINFRELPLVLFTRRIHCISLVAITIQSSLFHRKTTTVYGHDFLQVCQTGFAAGWSNALGL